MKKKYFTIPAAFLITAIIYLINGCTVTNSLNDGELNYYDTGTIKIVLKGLSSYDPKMLEVNITITKIEATVDGVVWETVSDARNKIDLLELDDSVTAVLGINDIEPDLINEVRFIVSGDSGDNYVVVDKIGPPEYDLDIPSGALTGLKITQPFEVKGGSTTTVVIYLDEKDYTLDPDSDTYRLKPVITVDSIDHDDGKIIFYDDFGFGSNSDTVQGWSEDEASTALGKGKCSVLKGRILGGRHARISGDDVLGVNHNFYKDWDISGYTSGRIVIQVKRSDNWSNVLNDRVYLELFYDGSWHAPYTFNYFNISDTFSVLEIPLSSEMMDTQFNVRFRNGLPELNQFLDIDNFELHGVK